MRPELSLPHRCQTCRNLNRPGGDSRLNDVTTLTKFGRTVSDGDVCWWEALKTLETVRVRLTNSLAADKGGAASISRLV